MKLEGWRRGPTTGVALDNESSIPAAWAMQVLA